MKTAKELLEHGIVGEGASELARLRRCAADGGCAAWQTCDASLQGTWRESAKVTLPEATPRPEADDQAETAEASDLPEQASADQPGG